MPVGQQQQSVVCVQQGAAAPKKDHKFAKRSATFLGIASIIIGTLSMILQIASLAIESLLAFIAPGLWGGFMFVVLGVLSIIASKRTNTCTLTALMMISIKSALVTFIIIGVSSTQAMVDTGAMEEYGFYARYHVSLGLNAGLVILALLQLIFAIWTLAISCAAVCCRKKPQNQANAQPPQGGYAVVPVPPANFAPPPVYGSQPGGFTIVSQQQTQPQSISAQPFSHQAPVTSTAGALASPLAAIGLAPLVGPAAATMAPPLYNFASSEKV